MNIPGRALVIGYGLSGRAAAHWLASHGSEVVVLEDDPEVARGAQASVKIPNLTVRIGRGPERAWAELDPVHRAVERGDVPARAPRGRELPGCAGRPGRALRVRAGHGQPG